MRDGAYDLSLAIDRHIGHGTLSLFADHGHGQDGVFRIEVHVSGAGHDLRGIVNVLGAAEPTRPHDMPQHFSLAVVGSGNDDQFNLIGSGPHHVLIEVDAVWGAVSSSSSHDGWP